MRFAARLLAVGIMLVVVAVGLHLFGMPKEEAFKYLDDHPFANAVALFAWPLGLVSFVLLAFSQKR